jgi:rhamnose transport system substrate-binding protein
VAGGVLLLVTACGPQGLQSSSARPTSTPETVGFVPPMISTASSDALALGLSDGAKRFGGTVFFEGPSSADPYDQAQYAQELVGRHPSAVGVAATDPTELCPTAEIARRAGVLFYAAGSNVDCPDVGLFVEPAPPQAVGSDTVDLLAANVHGAGDVAIVSAGPTQPDLESWIHFMQIRLAAYPRLHLVPVQTGATDGTDTTVVADRLMTAYPDLKGMIATSSANVGALARAVDQAGKQGRIVVTGVADPNDAKSSIDNGTVAGVVSYNSAHLGYLTYWAVTQMLHHRVFAPHDTVPGLAAPVTWTAANHTLLLGPPVIVTKANANRLDF